jgi:hypothetical protein
MNQPQIISMDDAIAKVGGFGKLQWLTLMAMVFAR